MENKISVWKIAAGVILGNIGTAILLTIPVFLSFAPMFNG